MKNVIGMAFIIALLLAWRVGCAHADEINMDIIAEIESGGEPLARNGDHIGLYQISPGVVIAYRESSEGFLRGMIYKHEDMYDATAARLVAGWYINREIPRYLKEYNIPDNKITRIASYNWGIGHVKKWYRAGARESALPRETRNYLKKYYKFEKEGL